MRKLLGIHFNPPPMIPDTISGDGTDANEGEHADLTENKKFPINQELEKHKEYQQDQSNNKASNDPTAARNVGANGYTQRANQKDQLENLHIGGTDTTPGGGNDHTHAGEQAQGPGFEAEGSYELDHNLRTREQAFGDKSPGGPATPAGDSESISNE
ncbi:MAG: hypothetical protein NVS3B25_30200 [Hymenobacter sp.]